MLINKNEDVEILAWDQLFERLVGAFLYLERQIKDKAKWDVFLMFWLLVKIAHIGDSFLLLLAEFSPKWTNVIKLPSRDKTL